MSIFYIFYLLTKFANNGINNVFEHIINIKILVMALKTIADVVEFLRGANVEFVEGSIHQVRLPRCNEPAWEFRGVFRDYRITREGRLISAI